MANVKAKKEEGKSAKAKKRSRARKKRVPIGRIYIQSTYNNTLITVTDQTGNVLAWSSSGRIGYSGAKKSTPFAAQEVVRDLADRLAPFEMKEVSVFVKGIGSARESAVRAIGGLGIVVSSIVDQTPIPHNGPRPPAAAEGLTMATRGFDSVCARCRRAGQKLFLKGEKCFTPKCPMVRRPYAPGAHGASGSSRRGGRGRVSDFARQLVEKQALRAMYGLRDRQLKGYYRRALGKEGVTGDVLLSLLESRLDNVVYRLGYATSRAHARQMVSHGMFMVNGRAVNIPSRVMRTGDVVAVKEGKRDKGVFAGLEERLANHPLPSWLERQDPFTARVSDAPALEQTDMPVDVRAVVEFYSR